MTWFGTDGIRGPAGRFPVDRVGGWSLGWALAAEGASVAVARDTRPSAAELSSAVLAGVLQRGGRATDLGTLPTPGAAYWAASHATLVVVVTASHNPASDNGFKVFDSRGWKLDPEAEASLERAMDRARQEAQASPTIDGVEDRREEARALLMEAWKQRAPEGSLNGWAVALDCANGATTSIAPKAFEAAGAVCVRVVGDGQGTINDGVGATHPQTLAAKLMGAELGFCFDGDGDRVVLLKEGQGIVPGEALLAVLALALRRKGQLTGNVLVTTENANSGLDSSLAQQGIKVLRTPVGDRAVVSAMRSGGYSLGGEDSGHTVFGPGLLTGDGVATALTLAQMCREDPEGFVADIASVHLRPALARSLAAPRRLPLNGDDALGDALRAARRSLGDSGQIHLRYSGTEPLLRLRVEADSEEDASAAAARIEDAWEQVLQGSEQTEEA